MALKFDSPEDLFAHAVALQNDDRPAEAIRFYEILLKIKPLVTAARNLGVALSHVGRFAEAEHMLELAIRNRPGDPDLRLQLGHVQAAGGRTEAAEATYRSILALDPADKAAKLALGNLYLSLGRYAEGWPLIDVRFELNAAPRPAVPPGSRPWRGEPLAGASILVVNEQGFGDQIQMARFPPLLKARGASRVSLACPPALAALFATLQGVDAAGPIAEPHDYWISCFSLPEQLGVVLESLPTAPYLAVPPDRKPAAADGRVGLCWKTSPTGFNARNKNLPDEAAERLLQRGLVSLHPEDTGARDFADTAAIIETLDLVVSVDTAVAHLAGAMGKPCWTLLPFVRTDWRWLRGRSDSPWYPTMRLYRQSHPGDWSPELAQIESDLAARGVHT